MKVYIILILLSIAALGYTGVSLYEEGQKTERLKCNSEIQIQDIKQQDNVIQTKIYQQKIIQSIPDDISDRDDFMQLLFEERAAADASVSK